MIQENNNDIIFRKGDEVIGFECLKKLDKTYSGRLNRFIKGEFYQDKQILKERPTIKNIGRSKEIVEGQITKK